MNERVLLVDDDLNVLAGYRRQLRRDFHFETAESGSAGLETLASHGPFAVVISDMRMPKMDGIQFLTEVARRAPKTVRMMLTGNADLQTCIDAVNEGHIFRFMTKPCSPEDMSRAIRAAIEQYRLVMAEHDLMEGTLAGCLRTLTDILSVMSPGAFSRGSRIRRYARHIAAQLNSQHVWEYEMAATLSQIGCVALPPEILARVNSGRPLTNEQRSILAAHPTVGCQLLAEIPRLKIVALIVERQNNVSKERLLPHPDMTDDEVVELGAQVIRISLDLDQLLQHGESYIRALSALHEKYGPDHPLVEALMSFAKDEEDVVVTQVSAGELNTLMVAAQSIRDRHGREILAKGQRLTDAAIFHLRSCVKAEEVHEPFLVEVASGTP